MALVRVIDNESGAEAVVDEAWLIRWPDDYTPLSEDHVPLAEQERAEASGETPDPDPGDAPASPAKPSRRR